MCIRDRRIPRLITEDIELPRALIATPALAPRGETAVPALNQQDQQRLTHWVMRKLLQGAKTTGKTALALPWNITKPTGRLLYDVMTSEPMEDWWNRPNPYSAVQDAYDEQVR